MVTNQYVVCGVINSQRKCCVLWRLSCVQGANMIHRFIIHLSLSPSHTQMHTQRTHYKRSSSCRHAVDILLVVYRNNAIVFGLKLSAFFKFYGFCHFAVCGILITRLDSHPSCGNIFYTSTTAVPHSI